ncbi:PHD finger protein 24-like [Ptychodera flava]|uniref:PHD finger protein 24-like n=1 Tax=Ptychodera flava TaxID=63121 RepID=UPI003969FC67
MGVVLSRRTQARAEEVRRTTTVVNAFKSTQKNAGNVNGKENKEKSQNGVENETKNGVSDPLNGGRRSVVYTDTSAAWDALRSGKATDASNLPRSQFSVPQNHVPETKERKRSRRNSDEESVDIPYMPPDGWESLENKNSEDELCIVCGVFTGTELYPCRVCDKVYHEGCLSKIGKLNDSISLRMIEKANTVVGWSCHECENLNSLLRDDEMFELMDAFEKCDVDSDSNITSTEFLRYKKQSYREAEGKEMSSEQEEKEMEMFRLMDKDKTGYLTWWEFLNHESARRLATRSKKALIKLLTRKEINTAREAFRFFDKDCDGFITISEAKDAYRKWLGKFVVDPEKHSKGFGGNGNPDQFNQHVKQQAKIFMTADADNSGAVSWKEYLEEQSLYILSARPNVAPVHYKK